MPKVVELEKIKNEDKGKIKRFVFSVLSEFGFSPNTCLDSDLENLDSFYQKPDNNFWVLIENQEVIGTIGIAKESPKTAKLKRFYLKKHWRGKGWGRKLFQKVLQFCKRRGYQTLVAETTQKNKKAITFFKKMGFRLKEKRGISFYFSKELKA